MRPFQNLGRREVLVKLQVQGLSFADSFFLKITHRLKRTNQNTSIERIFMQQKQGNYSPVMHKKMLCGFKWYICRYTITNSLTNVINSLMKELILAKKLFFLRL